METILITGVAGFIASKTAELFLNDGFTVIGLDNLNDYYDVRLKEYRLERLKSNANFVFYSVDIEDKEALEEVFKKHFFKKVINLAARAGVRYSIQDPFVYFRTNAMGTLNLLELMKQFGQDKMVLASTSSLYAGQAMPFSETLPVNTPISPYAASKKSAETLCYTYHHLFDIDVSVLRYFTVYGPGGRPDMSYFRFIRLVDEGKPIELFGDGSQARDFTYVDDIAKGTVAASKKNLGYEIINLGGGRNPISINRMIELIEQYIGKKAVIDYKPFHKADMKETWADIDKAKRLLGWQPVVCLEDGLKSCVEWYIENKSWVSRLCL
jgi:nucleoside-diphosphate-sugar epimerase